MGGIRAATSPARAQNLRENGTSLIPICSCAWCYGSGRPDAYDIGPLLAGMAFVQPNVYWESAVSRSLGSTPKYPFGSICWVIGPIAADCSVCNFGLRARGRLLRFRHGER